MIDDYLYLKDTTAVFGVLFFEFLRRVQRLGLDIPALFCRSPKLHSADCGMQRLGHSYQIIEKMLRIKVGIFSESDIDRFYTFNPIQSEVIYPQIRS